MATLRNTWLVLAAACSIDATPGPARAAQGDPSAEGGAALLARVNGEPVTEAELRRLLGAPAERRGLQRELGTPEPDRAALERAALRRLIQQRLILQEAARRKLTVQEQELDDAIRSLRRRFEDLRSFGQWMKDQGLDDRALFEAVRADLLASRVRALLAEGANVTEEQARQYHDAHRDELRAEEVWLQVIAVDSRAAAEKVLASLREGHDFGLLARRLSIGARARQGGDAGWVDAATLGPPLREAVRTLKEGVALGPLPQGDTFLIVRLEARRSVARDLAATRPEIERRLLPGAQRRAIQAWLAEQEAKAEIEVLPRDRVASAKGG